MLIEATMRERPMTIRPTKNLETFFKAVTNEIIEDLVTSGVKPVEVGNHPGSAASSSNPVVTPLLGSCPFHADPPFAWMLVYFYMYIYI